jgi:glutamyl-tRNA reductase
LALSLESLRCSVPHSEVALLSTCNRTEVYGAGAARDVEAAYEWLASRDGGAKNMLRDCCVVMHDELAARHAFRVASGLESMVLGEPQILGQLKGAVRGAEKTGTLGTTLHQLFQRAFAVAKEVRSSTALGEHSISMAAASARIAGKLFGPMGGVRVLLVGAGEMIELVATHFAAKKPAVITVANRTYARAEALAKRVGGRSISLAEVGSSLHDFDVVVSCTSSQIPLVGLGAIQRAMRVRSDRRMLLVDLAVPNDIEPEARSEPGVHLYTVDDLSRIVESGRAGRQGAVTQAEAIVETGIVEFGRWLRQRESVPVLQTLNSRAEEWRLSEYGRARKLVAREGVDVALDCLSKRLVGKLLYGVRQELRTTEPEMREITTAAVQRFFLREEQRRCD